jgi:hypothetical protein
MDRATNALVRAVAVVLVAATGLAIGSPQAGAIRFDVMPTTTADVVDPADGLLSLREAVGELWTDGSPSGNVTLGAGLTYELTRCGPGGDVEDTNASGDLDLPPEDVAFSALGATIRQTCPGERVLEGDVGTTLSIVGTTLTGGDATSGGGAVLARDTLVLGPGTVIVGNQAQGDGGGALVRRSQGTNLVADGAEAAADDPAVLVLGAVVRDNESTSGDGGGLASEVPTTVLGSTFVGNVADDSGGALAVVEPSFGHPDEQPSLLVERSTVVRNLAGDHGGGVSGIGDVGVSVSTFVANRAPEGAHVDGDAATFTASVVALGSGSGDCALREGRSTSRLYGSDGSCETDREDGPGKLDHLHPLLAPLAAQGVATPTMAPIEGSQVIDGEPELPCAGGDQSQNGVPRPSGEGCDLGAHEGPPPTCTAGFPDVPAEHPFAAEVCHLAQLGITGGFADGTFRPSAPVTRQSMAAFLHRLAGSPPMAPPAAPTFTDVSTSHPFFLEVEWLADAGIAEGFPDGTFRGGRSVSRQAMAAFLHRVASSEEVPPPGAFTFSDVGPDHPFVTEITWLAWVQVSEGYADGTFRPAAPVSRQAMAAFLLRLAGEQRLAGL